jgi:hypothetical protein
MSKSGQTRRLEGTRRRHAPGLVGYDVTINPNYEERPSKGHLPCYRARVEAVSGDGRSVRVRPFVETLGTKAWSRRRWISLAAIQEMPEELVP